MSKKISPALLEAAIVAKVKTIKRKEEIFEELKKYDKELSSMHLNEVGMVGSFGFAAPNDVSSKTKTGFAEPQPLSYVKQLMDQMKDEETTEAISGPEAIAALKEENSTLKSELEALKKAAKTA